MHIISTLSGKSGLLGSLPGEGEERENAEGKKGKGRRGIVWMGRGGQGGMWYPPNCTLVFSDSGIVLRYLAGDAEEDGGSSCVRKMEEAVVCDGQLIYALIISNVSTHTPYHAVQ